MGKDISDIEDLTVEKLVAAEKPLGEPPPPEKHARKKVGRAGTPSKPTKKKAKGKGKKKGSKLPEVYFDGQKYWRKNYVGWYPYSKEDTQTHLNIGLMMSAKKKEDEFHSEVARTMYRLQQESFVDGVGPMLYEDEGLVLRRGVPYLNTSSLSVMEPAESGDIKLWQWFYDYIHFLFPAQIEREFFFAWVRRMYLGGYERNISPGHILIMCGSTSSGKTFLSSYILPMLMGGQGADATDLILGETQYGAMFFKEPVWSVDDPSPPNGFREKSKMSNVLKRLSANSEHVSNEKYVKSSPVTWVGRCIITVNDDVHSLGSMPEVHDSMKDKFLLLSCGWDGPDDHFSGDRKENQRRVAECLPHFARWLLDTNHDNLPVDARYGFKGYQNPALMASTDEGKPEMQLAHILGDWFLSNVTEESLRGSATNIAMILQKAGFKLPCSTPTYLGRYLNRLVEQKWGEVVSRKSNTNIYEFTEAHVSKMLLPFRGGGDEV